MCREKVPPVLDRVYGEKLKNLVTQMAVWIIDTPSNKTVAQEIWSLRSGPEHTLTTFDCLDIVDETCFEGLRDDRELHQGHYSQIPASQERARVGLLSSPVIDNILGWYRFSRVKDTAVGFRAVHSLETGNQKLETEN